RERSEREDGPTSRQNRNFRRGDREGEPEFKPMTYSRLRLWSENTNAGDLIIFMSNERKQIEHFLNEKKIKEDWFKLFLKAVSHGITAQHQKESIKQVLEVICKSSFLEYHLIMCLNNCEFSEHNWGNDGVNFLADMVSLLKEILEKLPTYALKCAVASSQLQKSSELIRCVSRKNSPLIVTLQDVLDKAKLIVKREKDKETAKKVEQFMKAGKNDKPPDNFLELPIVPTVHDLKADANPFVRCAVTDGAYDDAQHYLDIQFRLMRQDFIFPLRQGINEFRAAGCKKNFNCSDLRLYFDVHIVGTVFKDGIDHILQFDVSKLASVKWEFSKRLIFGSLLCLSKDNFETVIFATVAHREVGQLAKGNITVNVKSGLDLVFNSTSNDVYVMAETTAYFESYCHVLEGLQEMVDNLPLQDYIIKCKKELRPPKYIFPSRVTIRSPVYNLSCLMLHQGYHQYPVVTTDKWPQAEFMCLNRSQREAVMLALTKELAVIQGPPGTGKTYVGLKVMQVLLANKSVMAGNEENADDPILVVCYTNHALDQFLEGVLEFCPDGIVRVGGRVKSEKLDQFNIKSLRQKLPREKNRSNLSVRKSKYLCYKELEEISDKISQLNRVMESLETVIQTEDVLVGVIERRHYASLSQYGADVVLSRNKMRQWLNASSDTPEAVNEGGWRVKGRRALSFGRIRNKLVSIPPMSEEEENDVVDLWTLDLNKRFALYNRWIKKYKVSLTEQMEKLVEQYKSAHNRKIEANREETLALLKSAKVIGMTTTGAAKHRAVLQALGCRIIVVEEAAEVLESHIVTALNKKCNHLILIGDHQQLRPNPAVYELATKYGLEISLFERLIKNGVPHVLLQEQHRMRPEISKIMRHIYKKLEDHSSVLKYDHIRGVSKDVFFINHTEKEEKVDDTRSKANIHEAKFLIALYKYLLCQGYEASQITILATYTGQVYAIKKILREQRGEDIGKDFQQVRVTAVDNFQGEENDIILLSLVRSNEQNNVGFLKVDNRVCVALSRAKKGLFVIGNFNVLRTQSKLWEKIILTAHDNKRTVSSDTDFDKYPNGGCGQPCGYRLDCGHVCARPCHANDLEHRNVQCRKPCLKTCERKHSCKKMCFQDCEVCAVLVPRKFNKCGHHPCSGKCNQCRRDGRHSDCHVDVKISTPCGHDNITQCFLKSSNVECQMVCGSVLGCGHTCKGQCSNCLGGAVHVACEEPCGKVLPCGHKCKGFCGAPCLPCSQTCPVRCEHGTCSTHNSVKLCSHSCPPCFEPCTHKCPHLNCPKRCSEMCDSEPCSVKCTRRAHVCSDLCG
ncbi:unnamed protein product, partial [Lymnaea stagnalis]